MKQSSFQVTDLNLCIPEREPQDITFTLNEGDVLEIKGPSGSGKTTLLKILARLYPSSSGVISLDGKQTSEVTPQVWRREVAYLAQKPALLPGTSLDNLRTPFSLHVAHKAKFPKEKAEKLLSDLGIDDATAQRGSRVLSGGEGARVALARALLLGPRVLLSDEVSAALDDRSRKQTVAVIKNWMREQGGILIFTAHDHHFAEEFADREILTLKNIKQNQTR
jgi:putative ABC transport system ATP-binding protein